ncbi:FAD-dependent oxidoreductase [Streptomyces polygonati]|uniref:FAD-dependent oxidoreductase n=1 Tax=Streptomyces polygonati TaxID=1617087 RepID=A0ABV8HKD0_9ACTN
MTATARVVVVGAGVTGLLAAVECALAGHRVTVFDRGPIPNPRSTSYDQHRAIRTLVVGDPAATGRLLAAHRRWLELEAVLGAAFYRRVGVVTAWPAERLPEVAAEAAAAGVTVRRVEPPRLPQLGFPAGTAGVWEEAAGVLLADRVLAAAARWLAAHPAVELRPGTAVSAVDAGTGRVALAGGGTAGADLVLVGAGPWTRDLVPHPVVLNRQTMLYLRPPEESASWWRDVPAVGGLGLDGQGWMVPPGDGTLLKISSNAVCRTVDSADADDEDQAPWAEQLAGAGVLHGIDRYTVAAVKACHYATDTRTGGAHLARVSRAVWSRAACGGNGFAAAPLVGQRIAEAAREAAV